MSLRPCLALPSSLLRLSPISMTGAAHLGETDRSDHVDMDLPMCYFYEFQSGLRTPSGI